MEINDMMDSIANMAVTFKQTQFSQEYSMAVTKKVMDT